MHFTDAAFYWIHIPNVLFADFMSWKINNRGWLVWAWLMGILNLAFHCSQEPSQPEMRNEMEFSAEHWMQYSISRCFSKGLNHSMFFSCKAPMVSDLCSPSVGFLELDSILHCLTLVWLFFPFSNFYPDKKNGPQGIRRYWSLSLYEKTCLTSNG